ncbi:uncharacterized protein LOC129243799 isoform X1 [Anastrepha obliqua]|uniref:uncharacterized protein LOC129243799 isoform X1 n=1 Tax=Anastrepha obliqua TaxID=95512 RepID=UPI0024094FEF|nr:uncharacterized protein LOC129243799 isoform X1 [Anastrepha obliqua]
MFCYIFVLLFMNCMNNCWCLDVNFRKFYGAQLEPFHTQMQKREMTQFFDKAAYSFNGLEKIASVPVSFPIDICILPLEDVKYAASLHKTKNGVRHFTVYKNVNQNYHELYNIATPNAIAMDCKAIGSKGYIALALNITQVIENARDGSPIYELTADDRLRAVQFFAATHLYSVYLRTSANDLFMLQTFRSSNEKASPHCPYYKWSGTSFTLLARIPCSNARHVEPFAINFENYVALANYADQTGRTTTHSEIYKFNREKKKFELVQKIRTHGAVDVRYFSAPLDEVKRRHFLVYANSVDTRKTGGGDANEADSIFYLFDKGQFVPYQSLSLYAVEQFLPVQNVDAEKFLLLIASKDQDTKIYNLNDWKFEPSNVQFTEGALGRGVSKMRIHQEDDKSYLVIANEKMNENDTNIFLPIFKQDEHVNSLRQQIIDWTKTQIERLAQIDVNKLKTEVEQKLEQSQRLNVKMQVQDIPQADIQTVNTNSFVYPKYHFTSHYWQALNFATQAVDGLEVLLKSPTAAKRFRRATTPTEPIKEFDTIKVGTLIVKEDLNAYQVNGVDAAEPTFERVNAKKVRVTGRYQAAERTPTENVAMTPATTIVVPTLAAKHLQINGTLNKHKWYDLLNNTLKRDGVQFVNQPAHIVNLVAESVRVLGDEIKGKNLHELISIDGGDSVIVVNQSVIFEEPVKAKELLIHERLNHIKVHQEKLDVLLKRTNATQVVEGAKRFENVRILQPIEMVVSEGGQTLGPRLQALASQQIVHGNFILNGDFTIKGDAIVADFLSVNDLIDQSSQMSTKQTLLNGLDITQPLEDINIKFEQPLEANNTLLTFVNAIDMQQLIKTNFSDLQVIEGEKHFNQTLVVREGYIEVKYLNGVDTENLTEHLLLKSANQSIQVPMYFGKIQTPSIIAHNLTLRDKPLEVFVTRGEQQHMPMTLSVAELSAQTLNIEQLHTSGRICGKSVISEHEQPLIAQLLSNVTKYSDLLPPGQKFRNTIVVDNLLLGNGSVNGRKVQDIEKQLQHLNADIQLEGNHKFNYDMNISQLTFQGKFNDIPAEEFGRCWLQKSGAQMFTAPQSFSDVNCLEGVQLEGSLNGRALDDFTLKAYWINRDEFINTMEFQNPIQMQAPLSTSTLNGVHVPLDIIYANSSVPQIIYASASIHGQLNVIGSGAICNVSTLNGMHLLKLQQFLKAGGADTLHVEHANFAQTPLYHSLNHHELAILLDRVWLANENVRLSQHVELANTTFEGLLEFEGLVNNINLHYLKDNYLSLSRPQEIGTELILASEANFEGDLTANNVQLEGLLVESSSNLSTNFDEFVGNTLKTDGPHEVLAAWSLLSALIQGDIENVQINNLNLVQDVVRLDIPSAPITAPKRLTAASIEKLYSEISSTINAVPIVDWINGAVYIHGNHTINGTTFLDTVNMYNDLGVLGAINSIANFGEKTLLLRNLPQTLHGDVHINNFFPKDRRILMNNFENLRAKSINGQQIDMFYKQHAKSSSEITIQGSLVFLQPLVVQDYHNQPVSELKWKRNSSSVVDVLNTNNQQMSEMPSWKTMLTMVQQLKQSLDTPYYLLDKFIIRQKLSINATKIVPLKIREGHGQTLDVIAVVDKTNATMPLHYYEWSIQEKQFQPIQDYSWLPKEETLDLVTFISSEFNNGLNFAVVNKTSPPYLLSNLKSVLGNLLQGEQHNIKLTFLTINGERCFLPHPVTKSVLNKIFCLKKEFETRIVVYEKFVIPRKDIREVLQVSPNKIVLLLSDCVEIWRIDPSFEVLKRLPFSKAAKIATGALNNTVFLAVQTEKEPNSLHCNTLEIYSSINSAHFERLQSLDCVDPLQFSFSNVTATGDLLLYILSRTTEAPLTIYQYKGVLGFKQILGSTSLPAMQSHKVLHLENATKSMIVLMRDGDLTFVEIGLRKF